MFHFPIPALSPSLIPAAGRGVADVVVVLMLLIEYLWHRSRNSDGYDWHETAVSTTIMVGQILSRVLTAALVTPVILWVYRHRLFDIALDGWLPIVSLFLGLEFLYYWFHRSSHKLRWLWATHGVHHSSTRLNFSAAYRLGWTSGLSGGWLFFVPLVWLGFSPVAVFGLFAANLAFQFFLHTEMIGRLGFLEWIFNTPSHHRVHHASNSELLDRNFGGVLIVFDRLFGTHADEPRDVRLTYGLAGGLDGAPASSNPFGVALGEWSHLVRDLVRARSLREVWRAAVGPA